MGPGHDSAELTTACWCLGVPHPPGYPLYVRLGNLWGKLLGIGDYAWRINLLSAFLLASTSAVLAWLVRRATLSWEAGWVAGLGFALLRSVWNQALLAEVFPLHLLLLVVLAASAWTGHRGWFFFFLGLALAHQHIILLALPGLFWLRPSWWRSRFWLGSIGVALVFYLDMAWRAQAQPALNWGAISNLDDWIGHISRRAYGTVRLSARPSGLSMGMAHALAFVIFTLKQQGAILWLALAGYGIWKGRRLHPGLWGLAVGWLIAYGPFFAILGQQGGDAFHLDLMERFYVSAYLGLAILVGLGWAAWRPHWLWLSLFLLPPLLFNWRACDLSGRELCRSYARTLLEGCPPQAVLLVTGDLPIGAVEYLQQVEKCRSDVLVVCSGLLAAPWYQRQLGIEAANLSEVETWCERQSRPLCSNQSFSREWICHGVWWQRGGNPPTRSELQEALRAAACVRPGLLAEQRFWPRYLISQHLEGLRRLCDQLYQKEPRLCLLALDFLLEVSPGRPLDYLNRGLLHLHLGHSGAARSDLQQALKLNPDLELARQALGQIGD